MSAAIAAGVIGTGFSIYSGIQGGKAASRNLSAAEDALKQNQLIASDLRAQEAPAQAITQQKIGELSSAGLTPGAQMAQDALKAQIAQSNRQIQAQSALTGAGLAGARQLTNQFRQAQGIAGIGLEDQVNKNAQLGNWVDRASAVPGWAQVASGANTQQAGFQENQANQNQANSASAYGAAAQGLMGLAKLFNPVQPQVGQPVQPIDPSINWGQPIPTWTDMSALRNQ